MSNGAKERARDIFSQNEREKRDREKRSNTDQSIQKIGSDR